MKITLQENDMPESELKDVYLSDDGFDVPGWLTFTVGDSVADIHITDLYHACLALYSKYRSQMDMQ